MSFSTNSRNDSVKRLTERVFSPDCSDILFVRRHDEQKDTAKSGTALLRNPAFVASKKKKFSAEAFSPDRRSSPSS